ncbi:MAG: non-homologous end-joining DNA ligase [Armatimonadota bacterium]|nr:non-homologous end-joining DNA ligase [Armatimonadota bacterium]
MGLDTYRRKRRFEQTPEPTGEVRPSAGPLRFVVQEHHATRFHHDVRLEMEGVLRSWAVPKGVSLDPAHKRLAVLVEDHPLDYIDFEGVIPEGNYGAGVVMVWDRGTYRCLEGDPAEAFRRGKLTVVLEGQKLRGEFHLVRTGGRRRAPDGGALGGENAWLLFKGKDAFAVPGWTLPQPARSVKSGRTIEEIRTDRSAQWTTTPLETPAARAAPADSPHRQTAAAPPPGEAESLRALGLDRPGQDPFPEGLLPMLARLRDEPFDDPAWLFEVKWDGVRALAYLRRQGVERTVLLQSRRLNPLNRQYPEVVEALHAADLPDVVLDGEIIALDPQGRPSFQRLQQRLNLQRPEDVAEARRRVPVVYVVFDVLYYHGHALLARPLRERRQVLQAVLPPGPVLWRSEAFPGEGVAFYRAAQAQGLEGIMGKRLDSPYEPGRRSGAWVKIKVRRTLQAVVGGYTAGRDARRATFGALLVGLYDARGRLQYIGHVGGGFTEADLREVLRRLTPLVRPDPPFATRPLVNEPATWVEPELVVGVEFTEWTDDGYLRNPVFTGVVEDVVPASLRLEEVRPPRTSEAPVEAAAAPAGAAGRGAAGADAGAAGSEAGAVAAELARLDLPVTFTNLDKVFWPELGLTKGDLIRYYLQVHRWILPHLRDRPLTLRRFPDGIEGAAFYQKDYPDPPDFVETVRVWTETTKTTNRVVICNNLATLLWLAQLGCIEMHAWYSRITPARRGEGQGRRRPHTDFASSEEARTTSVLNYPDQVVFDIDPFIYPKGEGPRAGPAEKDPTYTRAGFDAAVEAALRIRDLLERLGLRSFVKTTGKTGVHVYVPVRRRHTYEETHAFAKTLCQFLEAQHPDRFTTEWAVAKRVGKVFLDYNQNRLEATLASAYSLRPTPEATVSTPLTWEELERGADPLTFTWQSVPQRLAERGDPWADMSQVDQTLDEALRATALSDGGEATPARRARTPRTRGGGRRRG